MDEFCTSVLHCRRLRSPVRPTGRVRIATGKDSVRDLDVTSAGFRCAFYSQSRRVDRFYRGYHVAALVLRRGVVISGGINGHLYDRRFRRGAFTPVVNEGERLAAMVTWSPVVVNVTGRTVTHVPDIERDGLRCFQDEYLGAPIRVPSFVR